MERKQPFLVAALLVAFFALCPASKAATTTVGSASLKPTGLSGVALPVQYGTPTCFSILLSTQNPTQILPADGARGALWIVNASTINIAAAGQFIRPPVVYLTTGTTTNLGVSPVSANLYKLNALPLWPCNPDTVSNYKCNNGGRIDMVGTAIWKAAIFGLAEGDHTGTGGLASAGVDTSGYVQGCSLNP